MEYSIDSSDNEMEIKKRTMSFNKKFPEFENEEDLTEDNIWQIVEKLNFTEKINKNRAKELFNRLDKNKKGKIKKTEFVEYLVSNRENDSNFRNFFDIVNLELASKSEKIVSILKKVREKLNAHQDLESVEDINWYNLVNYRIITQILDSNINNDIHDLEYNEMNKFESQAYETGNIGNKETVQYIGQFSKYWDQSRRNSDLSKVHTMYSSFKAHTKKHSQIGKQSKIVMNLKDVRRGSSLLNSVNSNPSTALRLAAILNKINTCEFDIFELDALVDRKTLFLMANEIFNRYSFLDFIDEDKFKDFMGHIIQGYDRKVTYHNDLHAGDVLQTTFNIFNSSDLQRKLSLQDIDILSLFISAIIHDYKHPGMNNIYHVNAGTKLAIRYNDASVLENYHVSQAFKILSRPECNIFDTFSPEEYRTIRRRMIECVLATDMVNHTKHLNSLKAKMESYDIKHGINLEKMISPDNFSKNYDNQQTILSNILHAADISNPSKPEKMYDQWIKKLFNEFYKQGDLERKSNLPISILCDRTTTNIEKAQHGFISYIVLPFWETLYNAIPNIETYLNNIKSNLKRFEEISNQEPKKNYKEGEK